MILAAGLGTRLRPLTNDIPKAMVEVGGMPMLERVARRLIEAGADRLIINVSPFADRIRDFVAAKDGFGVDVRISDEPDGPLDTGGGLLHAREHFRADAPFVIHNADIVTDIDPAALLTAHDPDSIATLAVRAAETDRYLLVDDDGLLGYAYAGTEHTARDPQGAVRHVDFCGVHVLDPRIFDAMERTGRFSIMDVYLRLVGAGERVGAWDIDDTLWIDAGTHERLEAARRAVG